MQRLIAFGSGIAVIILVVATYIATMMGGSDDIFAECTGSQSAGAVGGPFTLVDENGQTVTDQDVITEPTLLYFGYTFCPEVCPTTLAELTRWIRELGPDADRLNYVFVTVDPQRDTVKLMHDYVSSFDPRLRGFTGTPEQVAATVVVTIDHDRLREGVGAAHLDTGHDLSASETRRVACNAGILPAVLSGASLPLDLGRSNRFFSEAQRVALATTYDECAAEGCDRPYAWSELHHEDPWAKGGATDLDLAVPLVQQVQHRRGGLLDGAAGHVDHRPAMSSE